MSSLLCNSSKGFLSSPAPDLVAAWHKGDLSLGPVWPLTAFSATLSLPHRVEISSGEEWGQGSQFQFSHPLLVAEKSDHKVHHQPPSPVVGNGGGQWWATKVAIGPVTPMPRALPTETAGCQENHTLWHFKYSNYATIWKSPLHLETFLSFDSIVCSLQNRDDSLLMVKLETSALECSKTATSSHRNREDNIIGES